MNNYDISIIKELWRKEKEKPLNEYRPKEININSVHGECSSITFGLNCIIISKYIEGKRHTLTVQNWRSLTFTEFVNKIQDTRWKKI